MFERHARGATPTAEALFLVERASFMLRYAEQTKLDMTALQREPRGPVSIGLSSSLAAILIVPLMRTMRERYPEVRLRIVEGFSPALQRMLAEGTVDIAVLNGPIQQSSLTTLPLLVETMCLIGRAGDRRVRGTTVRFQRLGDWPLVMTGLAKSGVRLELETKAAHLDVTLNEAVEVETLDVAKRLVIDGGELTVHFAANVRKELEAKILRALPIPGLTLRRVLARASDRPASRATEVAMTTLAAQIREEVKSGRWTNAELEDA